MLIVFSIVATGNHFWTDAVLGAVVASIALGAAWLIERRWPSLPESARKRLHIESASESALRAGHRLRVQVAAPR